MLFGITDVKRTYQRFFFLFLFSFFLVSKVYSAEPLPHELNGVGIQEQIGVQLPMDMRFTNSDGEVLELADMIDNKPVILSFVYYTCPMLCSIVTDGIRDSINDSPLLLGTDYNVISISIDPNDSTSNARAFQMKYRSELKDRHSDEDWSFYISPDNGVKDLATQLGFNYKFDKKSGEYLHSAGIMIISPEGVLSRVLYGISYTPFDLKLALLEATNKKLVSTVDKVLLFCYTYVSESRGYVLFARNVMKLGGVVTVMFIALMIWMLLRQEKRNKINER